MRHIVHLITALDVGGAEMTLARLVESLDPARFQNTVVSLAPIGALAPRFTAAGIHLHSLGMGRNPTALLGAIVRLSRLLRRLDPDILQTWLYHADFMGLLAGRLTGIRPIIWNLRCADMDLSRYAASTRWLVRLLARLSRYPDAVIVNSAAGKSWHEALGYRPRRWAMIPNGFDTERFQPRPAARVALRAQLGLGDDIPVIGTVSRLDPMKDPGTFLQAAVMLAECRSDVHFVMVGRGLESGNPAMTFDARVARLGGRLHLLGQRSDIADLLAGFDVFALTSQSEGFPNALGEAMACGLACVATDVGDARMLLGDAGRVVARGNPRLLTDTWDDLLARPLPERLALGARARARIKAEFSQAKSTTAYEGIYTDLARRC